MQREIPVPKKVLWVLLLVLPLAVVEGAARLIYSYESVLFNPALSYLEPDATLFWRLRSLHQTTIRNGIPHQTNAFGLRDGEIAIDKPQDTFRILSLGESTTWGDYVRADETYSKVLEQRLNERYKGTKPRFEVINAGVYGYSLWQSYVYLEEHGQDFLPDVVLIYHQASDFLPMGIYDRNNYLYHQVNTDRDEYLERRKLKTGLKLLYRSRFFLAMRRLLVESGSDSTVEELRQSSQGEGPRAPDADRQQALHRISALCRVMGITPIILQPVYKDLFHGDALLARFAVDNGIAYIDLPYIRYTMPWPETPALFVDAFHPTAAGHRLIAETILRRLRTLKMLPQDQGNPESGPQDGGTATPQPATPTPE